MERVFYNSRLYSLYEGSLLQLCSFCFTANVLKTIMRITSVLIELIKWEFEYTRFAFQDELVDRLLKIEYF